MSISSYPSWRLNLLRSIPFFLKFILRVFRLYKQGYQNTLDLKISHKEIEFDTLPESFHGMRILFLSDLHIGKVKEFPDAIIEKIKDIEIDLCLFGGDYRYCCFTHPRLPFLEELGRIISNIRAPMGIYGVLGNHDDIARVSDIEGLGLQLLLNTSVPIERDSDKIYLVGVDEPFYYRRHDTEKAFHSVPESAFALCLTHAPDIFREVEKHKPDLYLCGHTHHGQIRFPWLGPVVTGTTAPRKFADGLWQYKEMRGYTGPGVGSGNPSVRFLCPPEIVVLTLNSTRKKNAS